MTPALETEARALIAAYPRPAGALLPLIERVLRETGACDTAACAWIAAQVGLPVAVVRGIASSRAPEGAAGATDDTVRLCTGLSCRWMGADAALEQLRAAGLRIVTVDCLGACAAAPVMARGGRLHDGLTPERLADLVAGSAGGRR